MNKVSLIGRLTRDPELKTVGSGISATKFSLAVNRTYTNEDGEREADYINCIAWKKTAELICSRLSKGSQVGIVGRIQTGSFDGENGRVYTTDVVVESVTFVDAKKKEEVAETKKADNSSVFLEFGNAVEIDDGFLD
jgi:single-strand DNA-binding protein